MKDRNWFDADYSQGRIDGKAVVLARGNDYYPHRFTRDDLPWRVCAVVNGDMDTARKIATLLNGPKP